MPLETDSFHGGFAYNREQWDRAGGDDHARCITGSSSPDYYDRSGWVDVLRLIHRCPDYRRRSVLEWGCGSGRITQYLCYLFREVHAIDIAPGMLSILRERRLPGLTIWRTSGDDLDAGVRVDVVYSYLCWMHNRKKDLGGILRTCRRHLLPEGRLLFQLPVYDQPREPRSYIDLACWTPEELRVLAGETGFEIVTMAASPGSFSMDAIGARHFDLHEWRPRAGGERPA
jgi:SAM-dependent methyltransferase